MIGFDGNSEKWISIPEAAKLTPYSTEYLSLLARRGRIGAKKVGYNWFTTEGIVKEYLSKQSIKKAKEEEKWISMPEAAEMSPYSAEYLSLLARKGRLKAKKVGYNWFTTKEVIEKYVDEQLAKKPEPAFAKPAKVSGWKMAADATVGTFTAIAIIGSAFFWTDNFAPALAYRIVDGAQAANIFSSIKNLFGSKSASQPKYIELSDLEIVRDNLRNELLGLVPTSTPFEVSRPAPAPQSVVIYQSAPVNTSLFATREVVKEIYRDFHSQTDRNVDLIPRAIDTLTEDLEASFNTLDLISASSTLTNLFFTTAVGTSATITQATTTSLFSQSASFNTLNLTQLSNGSNILRASRITDTLSTGDFISYWNAAGDTQLFRVDNSGNIYAGGIANSGAITITSVTTPQLRVQYDSNNEITTAVSNTGATTLGLIGSTPRLTITPQSNRTDTLKVTDASSNPILNVDTTNGRVGVGTSTPSDKLVISGNVQVGGAGYPLAPYAVFASQNNAYLQIYDGTSVAANTNVAHLNLATNQTGIGVAVGQVNFSNGSLSSGEKRLGAINVVTSGATNSGEMRLFITNGGTLGQVMTINASGSVGIGTTSPGAMLSVRTGTNGDGIRLTHNISSANDWGLRIREATLSEGTLGIYDYNAAAYRMLFTSSGDVGIGTTTPSSRLHVEGSNAKLTLHGGSVGGAPSIDLVRSGQQTWTLAHLSNSFGIQDSGFGSTPFRIEDDAPTDTLRLSTFGNVGIGSSAPSDKLEVVGNIISKGTSWTSRTSTGGQWFNVAYGNGTFVAVTSNGVMTSPDGINWTSRTPANSNDWFGVTYGNGLFVAVAQSGTGNRVMTSPDGITWTARTSASDSLWTNVAYGNGTFVAIGFTGEVMTSPDGITWTTRTASDSNVRFGLTYGNGLFVAVAITGSGNRVMTSPDGITWTTRTSAADESWVSVTYGNGLFVAVAISGTGNRVMTSPDGITWTARTSAADNDWRGVGYGNGLFVAVASTGTGNRVMTSPDGINWVTRSSAANNFWRAVTYGNGTFVAVAQDGSPTQVMTSGRTEQNQIATGNVFQGNNFFMENVGIGTTTVASPFSLSIGNGGIAINRSSSPFIYFANAGVGSGQIKSPVSSRISITDLTGSNEYLSVNTTSGNVGVGTTTPGQNLVVGSSGNTVVEIAGIGVPGLKIRDYTSGGRDWRVEQSRTARGELNISDCTSGSCGTQLSINSTTGLTTLGSGGSGIGSILAIADGAATPYTGGVSGGSGIVLYQARYLTSNNGGANNANYRLIGMNTSNVVDIDPDGRGITTGGTINAGSQNGYSIDSVQVVKRDGSTVYLNHIGGNAAIMAAGTQTYLQGDTLFFRNSNGASEYGRFSSTGNFGIGATNPSYRLEVVSTGSNIASFAGSNGANMVTISTTTSNYTKLKVQDIGGRSISIVTSNTELATSEPYISAIANGMGGGVTFSSATNADSNFMSLQARGDIALWTNSGSSSLIERMRITAAGNVGIGTSTPESKLTIENNSQGMLIEGASIRSRYLGGGSLTDVRFEINNNINGRSASGNVPGIIFKNADSAKYSVFAPQSGQGGLAFFTGGTTDSNATEKLRIDDNGNVGIGTSTPASTLSLYNGSENASVTNFTQTTANSIINIVTDYTNLTYTGGVFWSTGNNNAGKPKAGIWTYNDGSAGTSLFLGTSNSFATGVTNQAITINPTGLVGIGTTTPTRSLDVNGSLRSRGGLFVDRTTGDLAAYSFIVQRDAGSSSNFGNALGDGAAEFSTFNTAGIILGTVGAQPVAIGTTNVERMRITSGGNVGIGTSTPQFPVSIQANSGANALNIIGRNNGTNDEATITFTDNDGNTSAGLQTLSNRLQIFAVGGVGVSNLTAATANHICYDTTTLSGYNTFATCSSLRELKDNIIDLNPGIETLMQLTPRSFSNKKTGQFQYGFIAEEVNEVDPTLSTFYQGQLNGVDYDGLVSLLVRSTQQINERLMQVELNLASASTSLTISTSTPGFFAAVIEAVENTVFNLLRANEVRTSKLCVDDVCVTRERFLEIVGTGEPVQSSGGGGSNTPEPAPNASSSPETATTTPDTASSTPEVAETASEPEASVEPEPVRAEESVNVDSTPETAQI